MTIKTYTVIAKTERDENRFSVVAASPFDEVVTYLVSHLISTHGVLSVHLFEGDEIGNLGSAIDFQWDRLVLSWRPDKLPVYYLQNIKKLEEAEA